MKLSRVLFLSFFALVVLGPAAVAVSAAAKPSTTACLQDDNLNSFITWDETTGNYMFMTCGANSITLTGVGKVGLVNGIQTLTDSKPDRRINAGLLTSQLTGKATVMFSPAVGIWQTITVNDTKTNPTCSCPIISGGGYTPLLVFLVLVAAWRILGLRRSAKLSKATSQR